MGGHIFAPLLATRSPLAVGEGRNKREIRVGISNCVLLTNRSVLLAVSCRDSSLENIPNDSVLAAPFCSRRSRIRPKSPLSLSPLPSFSQRFACRTINCSARRMFALRIRKFITYRFRRSLVDPGSWCLLSSFVCH